MINRRKLKEVLEAAAKEAGGVRALARRSKINATSLQDYIDEKTIPGSKMISRLATYCRKSPAYFFDESISYADTQPTVASVMPINDSWDIYVAATLGKKDKYRVVAEVGEILDSGNSDIIDALVKNVREFRRAVDTAKKLNSCLEQIDAMQAQINKLTQKVEGLTIPPTGARASAASSGKGET